MDGKTIVGAFSAHIMTALDWEAMERAIDAAIAQARSEEREACAKVADAYAAKYALDSWDYGLLPTHDANVQSGKEALEAALARPGVQAVLGVEHQQSS